MYSKTNAGGGIFVFSSVRASKRGVVVAIHFFSAATENFLKPIQELGVIRDSVQSICG